MTKTEFFDEEPLESGRLPESYPDRGREKFPKREEVGFDPRFFVKNIRLTPPEGNPPPYMGLGTLFDLERS